MPYGACLVADAADRAGHPVMLLDLMFAKDPLAALAEAVRSYSPDVVGLSLRNLDNNDLQAPVEFVSSLTAISRVIRQMSAAPLVLGGAAVGIMPEALLQATQASFAILGDGETAFPLLLKALETGTSLSQVPRLAWLENGGLRLSSDQPCSLADSAVTARFDQWLKVRAYRANLAAAPLQSKRGCPFACIYCTYGISEGKAYRLFPPEEVAAAVRHLSAQGHRDIEFVDNVFNSPYDHALAICEHLADNGHRARLTTVELNPALLDDRLLRVMHRAGFVGVGLTAESAADRVLAGLKKGYAAADVARAAEAVHRSPLPCFWLFLLGGPGECEKTVKQTLDYARRVLRRQDVAFVNVGIRIYPGTDLERLARQEGLLSCQAQEMLLPVFYFSPELDLQWTLDQVHRAAAENLNLLHSGSLSHPWLPAINRIFSRLPVLKPIWRHTQAIRRVVRVLGRDI